MGTLLRRLGAVGILVGGLLFSSNGHVALAVGPAGSTSVSDDATYVYAPAPTGPDVQVVVVHGTPDADLDCVFDFEPSLAPGEDSIMADELTFTPSTCTSTYAVRSFDIDAGPATGPTGEDLSRDGTGVAVAPGTATLSAITSSGTHSAGYMKSYYEDPAQIDVNSVNNATDWYWTGSCINTVYGSYHYGWYSRSGWELKESNWHNYYYGCTNSESSSYVHYRNGKFCASVDTHTYYNRNVVRGYYNGYLRGAVSAAKKGGCTGFLSFHYKLKRTLN